MCAHDFPHDSPHVLEDPVDTLPGCTGIPTPDPSLLDVGDEGEHTKQDLQDDREKNNEMDCRRPDDTGAVHVDLFSKPSISHPVG